MKVSSALAQDRRAWSASIRDVVNPVGNAGSTHPGGMPPQVQVWDQSGATDNRWHMILTTYSGFRNIDRQIMIFQEKATSTLVLYVSQLCPRLCCDLRTPFVIQLSCNLVFIPQSVKFHLKFEVIDFKQM